MAQTKTVNMTPDYIPPRLHISQYDIGRELQFELTDGSVAYTIPSGATVKLEGTKPSGFGFTESCTVTGNTAAVSTTAGMTDEWGTVPCELVVEKSGLRLGSTNLLLVIEKSAHPEGTTDGSQETVIPTLTLLVERVEAAAASVNNLTVSATTLAPGSEATAVFDSTTDSIAFGIPRGADGTVTPGQLNEAVDGIKGELVPAIDGCENIINAEHFYVDYGYGYDKVEEKPSSSIAKERLGANQSLTMLTLNMSNPPTSLDPRIKITNGLNVAVNNTGMGAWTTGVSLTSGHRYTVYAKYIAGNISAPSGADTPFIIVVKAGAYANVGTIVTDGLNSKVSFVSDGSQYVVAMKARAGTTIANATYQITMIDETAKTAGRVDIANNYSGTNPFVWVTGIPSTTTGVMSHTNTKRITSGFIPVSDVKNFSVFSNDSYTYAGMIFRYNADGYAGLLTGGNAEDGYTWGTSGSLAIYGGFDFERMRKDYPDDVFRLAIRKKDSSGFVDITPSEAEQVVFSLLNKEENSIYNAIDPRWNAVAYSSVSGISDAAINSIEHYKYIATQYSNIFTSIKGDVRVTSDSHIIMCHDDGFTFDGNGRITTFDNSNKTLIHNMTYAQCMSLEYANLWNGVYPKVCDFETFLGICKAYGKTCYTVIRDEYISDIVDELVNTIGMMSMQNNVIINSFDYESLRIINAKCPSLMLSMVVDNAELTQNIIDDIAAFQFPMLCLFDWGGSSRTKWDALDAYKSNGLLDYAISKNVRLYEAIVSMSTSMPLDTFMRRSLTYGITGAQIGGLTAADLPI